MGVRGTARVPIHWVAQLLHSASEDDYAVK